jgi:hypothetical protein
VLAPSIDRRSKHEYLIKICKLGTGRASWTFLAGRAVRLSS